MRVPIHLYPAHLKIIYNRVGVGGGGGGGVRLRGGLRKGLLVVCGGGWSLVLFLLQGQSVEAACSFSLVLPMSLIMLVTFFMLYLI
ncbi:hypothetical protein F5148DRAFT_1246855 [Russula earlei]|uniref:Uncharacterized protein n=1 Tax=Russula earlei TaxID=71964 RepID=A0ACC0TUC5_9AGAM|nr:hypothetical protein F5148DRAFT_1246855 [Russula earlei]